MHKLPRLVAAALALALWALSSLAAEPPSVDVAAAREALGAGRAVLIDIREPDEQALGIAPGARRLPLSQLSSRLAEIPRDADQPVLLICRTQNRSGKLAQMLRAQGYGNVSVVDGGMSEWQRRGFATVTPPK